MHPNWGRSRSYQTCTHWV